MFCLDFLLSEHALPARDEALPPCCCDTPTARGCSRLKESFYNRLALRLGIRSRRAAFAYTLAHRVLGLQDSLSDAQRLTTKSSLRPLIVIHMSQASVAS